MATLWRNDICSSFNSTHRFYIRIRNLPKIACQSEIKTLLNEFDVPKGGISIYGSDAFIAFTDTQVALDAFNRVQDLLHGTAMLPSMINTTAKVNEAMYQKVRRNLNFDLEESFNEASDNSDQEISTESDIVISDEETPVVYVPTYKRKRLRPTTIPRGYKRIPFSCQNFFPEEIILPRINVLPISGGNMEQTCRRKIRPKQAISNESFEDWEISSVDECSEAKRIKLEESSDGLNEV